MYELVRAGNREYCEIFQKHAVRMAFVNKKEKECKEIFAPVLCRDFLGDVLHSEKTNHNVFIYQFRYNPKEQKIDRDKTRLSLHFPHHEMRENFVNNMQWLNSVERINDITQSQIQETSLKECLVIEGDPFWLGAIWRISLYTFLLKVCTYEFKNNDPIQSILDNKGSTEGRHLIDYNISKSQIENILGNIKQQTWMFYGEVEKSMDILFIHNYTGIMNTIAGNKKTHEMYGLR